MDAIPNAPGLQAPAWFGSDLHFCLESVLIPNRNPLDSDQNPNRIALSVSIQTRPRTVSSLLGGMSRDPWVVVGCCAYMYSSFTEVTLRPLSTSVSPGKYSSHTHDLGVQREMYKCVSPLDI